MRTLIATVLSLILGTAAMAADAQPAPPRELPVRIASAAVQKFERPMQNRKGRYQQALVLRIQADRRTWESLPPSIETFLYIGTHELRPMSTDLGRETVTLTFHDPDWQELKGGEPMVLTTEHGDPIHQPEKYAGHPRFDPKVIGEK